MPVLFCAVIPYCTIGIPATDTLPSDPGPTTVRPLKDHGEIPKSLEDSDPISFFCFERCQALRPLLATARRRSLVAFFSVSLCGCSAASLTSQDASLSVIMAGVFERSPDAAGNAEPKQIKFTLKGVDLIKEDGSAIDLWAGAEETTYRVVSRPQKIFEGSLADYVGQSFASLKLTFDPVVTGSGKYEDALDATLADDTPDFFKTLPVAKGKTLKVTVHVQWKDLIMRDTEASPPTETMTPPSLRFELDEG